MKKVEQREGGVLQVPPNNFGRFLICLFRLHVGLQYCVDGRFM